MRGGWPVETYGSRIDAENNNEAEAIAVDVARLIYPNEEIYTDSHFAAITCYAVLICRKFNNAAHRAADVAAADWESFYSEKIIVTPMRKMRLHKRNVAPRGIVRGRGVGPFANGVIYT